MWELSIVTRADIAWLSGRKVFYGQTSSSVSTSPRWPSGQASETREGKRTILYVIHVLSKFTEGLLCVLCAWPELVLEGSGPECGHPSLTVPWPQNATAQGGPHAGWLQVATILAPGSLQTDPQAAGLVEKRILSWWRPPPQVKRVHS